MTLEQAESQARPLFEKHGLRDWRISMENLRNTDVYGPSAEVDGNLGYCDFRNKTIRIDHAIGRKFRQTLLHEIAHALRGKPGHDQEWIEIAERLGCSSGHLLPYLLNV